MPSSTSSPPPARNTLQLLLDLPRELFDLILDEVPLSSQIALSITCHAAHQVFISLHGHDKTWASRLAMDYGWNKCDSLIEFLEVLERDLADRYFLCGQCLWLHPFYDLATETSPTEINRRLLRAANRGRLWTCPMVKAYPEPLEAFKTTPKAAPSNQMGHFSITARQLCLVAHFHRYGHGIPMSHFCGAKIATSSASALPSVSTGASLTSTSSPPPPLLPTTTTTTAAAAAAAAAAATPSSPRWRRRFDFGTHSNGDFSVLEHHELVYDGDDERAVRRYLDQTPHQLCPHLATHAGIAEEALDLQRLSQHRRAGRHRQRGGLAGSERDGSPPSPLRRDRGRAGRASRRPPFRVGVGRQGVVRCLPGTMELGDGNVFGQ
ncbi:hypothetical protein PG984_015364 [Apiospora sp. TS-2023a]